MFKENNINYTRTSSVKNLTMHAPSPVLTKNPSLSKLQRQPLQNTNGSKPSSMPVQKLPLGPRKPLMNLTNIKNNADQQSSSNSARQLSVNGLRTDIKESTQLYSSHQIQSTRQTRSSSSSSFQSAPQSTQPQPTQNSSNTQKLMHSQRESKLLRCLQESISDLNSCLKHPHQSSDILCLQCCLFICKDCTTDSTHRNHEFLNAHEFMECPILPFIQADKFLCETVSQSGKLAGRIKQKLDTQQQRVKECLDGMINWVQNRVEETLNEFAQSSEQQFRKITESIDSLENVSTVYKNEWLEWIGQNDINSKQELEEVCREFLKNGQSPKEELSKTCSSLRALLKYIPEPDFNALRDLYVRVADPLRFSYENLILEKNRGDILKPWENQLNLDLNSLNDYLQEGQDQANSIQTPVELISYLKNTNCIVEMNSLKNEVYLVSLAVNYQQAKGFQLNDHNRQLLFKCSEQSESNSIVSTLVTKDEKQLLISCKNQGVAVLQLNEFELPQTNCQISWLQQSNSTALAFCELSNSSLAVGYADNSIYFYSLNNPGIPFHAINLSFTPYVFHSTIDHSQSQSKELLAVAGMHVHDAQHPRPTLRQSYANNAIISILDVSYVPQTYVIQSLSSSIISAGIASMKFMRIPRNQQIKTQQDNQKDKSNFNELNYLEKNKQSSSQISSSYEVVLVILTQDCRIVTWSYLNHSALAVAFPLNFSNENICDFDQTKIRNVKTKKMQPPSKFQVFDADTLLIHYEGCIFAVSLSEQRVLGEITLIPQKNVKEDKKKQSFLSSKTFLITKNESAITSVFSRTHTHLGMYTQDN